MRLPALGAARLVLLTACGAGTAGARDEEGLSVVTSSHPLEFVAAAVAGDRAEVGNLVAPGADSHDAELSTRQLAEVVDADVVVHLTGLQPAVDDALAGGRGAALVTSHEAFGYLAQRYGLRQIGIAGVDPSVEPSPTRLRDVVAVVRENSGSTLFFESSANPAVAELLARDLGVATAVLHPVERVEAYEDYLWLARENLRSLRTGLAC